MSSAVLPFISSAEEAARELPLPPIAFFLIAFSLFLVLLGATWMFKGTAYKHQQHRAAPPGHDDHGHSAIDQGTHH